MHTRTTRKVLTIVAMLATTTAVLVPAAPAGAATPPPVVTFVDEAPGDNGVAWDEHATAERTYRWEANAAVEPVQTVTTACGAEGTKVDDTQAGIGTTSASGSFTCIFDDGPGLSVVSVVAVNNTNVPASHTGSATLDVDIANVVPATDIHSDTPSSVVHGASFDVTLTPATDASATDAGTGMRYAVRCSDDDAFSAFAAARTATCTAPTTGTSFTVYGKALDKDDGESVVVSKVIELTDEEEPPPTDDDDHVFRVGGEDRIQTATFVSRLEFPAGANVVFIATSWDYADALSAGPSSSLTPGPILLTPIDELASRTATELTRLDPERIIVVGGHAAVSDAVFDELGAYASESVTRVAGVDRFGTAAALSQALFPDGADTVYVATGRSYPDALAGGLAAGSESSPVLLTEKAALPASTRAEIDRLQPARIVVVGGTGAVSDAVAATLAELADEVDRISGADRFATTAQVVREVVPGTDTVFVVTGRNFADALTGIPVAAITSSAVLMVDAGELHPAVVAELDRLQPRSILILGGTAAVSADVAAELGEHIGDGTGGGTLGMQLTQEQIDAATD